MIGRLCNKLQRKTSTREMKTKLLVTLAAVGHGHRWFNSMEVDKKCHTQWDALWFISFKLINRIDWIKFSLKSFLNLKLNKKINVFLTCCTNHVILTMIAWLRCFSIFSQNLKQAAAVGHHHDDLTQNVGGISSSWT
jgi:hypothetical protein